MTGTGAWPLRGRRPGRRDPQQARRLTFASLRWVRHRSLDALVPRRSGGSVVGASAIVRGDIPERSVAVGAPARVVRNRITADEDAAAHRPRPPTSPARQRLPSRERLSSESM